MFIFILVIIVYVIAQREAALALYVTRRVLQRPWTACWENYVYLLWLQILGSYVVVRDTLREKDGWSDWSLVCIWANKSFSWLKKCLIEGTPVETDFLKQKFLSRAIKRNRSVQSTGQLVCLNPNKEFWINRFLGARDPSHTFSLHSIHPVTKIGDNIDVFLLLCKLRDA